MSWKRKRLEAMGEEDFYDVHLVGTDGEEVPCCRATLGMISPFFRSLFYRGFREQKTDRCRLDFRSLVLSVIVKYCYCGEVDMDLIFSENRSLEDQASLLVELRKAGRYFQMEDLSSTTEGKIGNLIFQKNMNKNNYQFASALYTELLKRDEEKGPLGLAIYQFILENTMECFGPKAHENNSTDSTCHAHPSVLLHVLENNKDTHAVVRCIQTWFSFENTSAGNRYSDEEKEALLKIAENIDLKKLSIKELAYIKPCSLFSSERILEAFVHHGKRSAEIVIETPRTKPRLYVSGAGMGNLNGFYEKSKVEHGGVLGLLDIFYKRVVHNGISCKSVIHRKFSDNKWLMTITKCDRLQFVRNDANRGEYEVYQDCIQTHVYESSCPSLCTEDSKVPPFNTWKCVEGTDPVPIVACIYQQSPDLQEDD